MCELATRLIESLICVSSEVVTLSLEKIGWEASTAVSIKESESSCECWARYTLDCGKAADASPGCLAALDSVLEEVVQEERAQSRVLVEGLLDVAKES